MINIPDKNTKLFFSLSSNPGIKGSETYNSIFAKKKKNSIYIPIKINSPADFNIFMSFLKCDILNFGGCSVSMPFKELAYKNVDQHNSSAKKTYNVNTIIKKGDKFVGYNTDYIAISRIMKNYKNIDISNILILGAGALSKSFISYFSKKKINLYVYNRDKKRLKSLNNFNINSKFTSKSGLLRLSPNMIINTIPISSKHYLFDSINLDNAKLVFDCILNKKETYLVKLSKKKSLKFIDGEDLYFYQNKYQRELYLNEL